ncbi:MAG: hypothetical protein AAF927_24970 [Bacteroidota bacterium]
MRQHRHKLLGSLALLGLAILSSCSQVTYERVIIDQRFSVEVPHYMEPQDNMHQDAPLQRGNVYESTYLIGRYDSLPEGETDLEAYYLNTFQQILPGVPVPYPDSIKIDDKLALHVQAAGSYSNRTLIYDLTLIQGETFLYQILSWTEQKAAADHLNDMRRIWQSFAELSR